MMITEKSEFIRRMEKAKTNKAPYKELRQEARKSVYKEDITALYVCIEEFSEIMKEITKDLRGNLDRDNLLQELSHAQLCTWWLQEHYQISDEEMETAVQASMPAYNQEEG